MTCPGATAPSDSDFSSSGTPSSASILHRGAEYFTAITAHDAGRP
jgi:hypothetical protein